MRTPKGMFIVISIMILLDFYVFNVLQSVSHAAAGDTKTIVYVIYWIIAFLAITGLVIFISTEPDFLSKKIRTYFFARKLHHFQRNCSKSKQ